MCKLSFPISLPNMLRTRPCFRSSLRYCSRCYLLYTPYRECRSPSRQRSESAKCHLSPRPHYQHPAFSPRRKSLRVVLRRPHALRSYRRCLRQRSAGEGCICYDQALRRQRPRARAKRYRLDSLRATFAGDLPSSVPNRSGQIHPLGIHDFLQQAQRNPLFGRQMASPGLAEEGVET